MNATVYYRVSSRSQEDNTSLENQKDEIFRYTTNRAITIAKAFQDVASAASGQRKGFQEVMQFIDENMDNLHVFIVTKYDRCHRNLRETLNFVHELEQKGIAYISVNQNIDTTTPQGKAFFHMICTFAEFEKDIIRERCRDGRKAKIKNKEAPGHRPPLGYDESWNMIPDEAEMVKDLFRQYLRVKSLRKLSCYAKQRCQKSGRQLDYAALRLILKNRVYLGEYRYDGNKEKHGVVWKHHHEKIMAYSIFGKVQKQLERSRKR